jgi:nuclear pore complex protein Nup85
MCVRAVTRKILEKLPADSAVIDDTIQSSLCSGDILPALIGCHDLDLWLAAHLGDVFDKLAMVPDDEER